MATVPDLPPLYVGPSPSGSQSAGGRAFSNCAKCGRKFKTPKNKFLTCGSSGFMVTWLYGYVALSLRGFMVMWLYGYVALWLRGFLVKWLYGYVALWLRGFMVTWLSYEVRDRQRESDGVHV